MAFILLSTSHSGFFLQYFSPSSSFTCRNTTHKNISRDIKSRPLIFCAVTSVAAPRQTTVKIGILGSSGYTGTELLRLLAQHPNLDITVLTVDRCAGQPIGNIYPQFSFGPYATSLPTMMRNDDVTDWASIVDIVFCYLPHATTQKIIASFPLEEGLRVIDLSDDFRLRDLNLYKKWYGEDHQAVGLQGEAVFGITELFREQEKNESWVANPGCLSITVQLPLIPLLVEKLTLPYYIIIDAKSGTSGAGRSAKVNTLFCKVSEGINAYGIVSHLHLPEIEQSLSEAYGQALQIIFTPYLMPASRSILDTMYVKLGDGVKAINLRECLHNKFATNTFVHLLPEGAAPPQTRHVRGSNNCVISVLDDVILGRAIIISVLDNVASVQAIQNMNVMMGIPETEQAVFP